MRKKYNTPHRSRVVKTRLSEDEYADFTARLAPYGISQSEFLRQAIRRTTIRPVIHVSAVNDELLSAVGKLAAEYGRIGGNLNQIARYLNEYGAPYNALSGEVRAAIADLAALKYEVLKKVGDAVVVINSLRIEEVPFLPYMDRPADTKAGCKHRCTDAALRYFKSEVMEMCHREGLYQIDLLNGSKNRVTDREYWAQKKGQAKLDRQNAPMIAGGITPRQTKFETNKEKLRQTIRKALATAASFDEFSSLLLREGVSVKESRGRLSYLTPDRTKPITARKLGDDFDRAAVFAVLEQNAARATEKAAAIPEYPRHRV